MLINKMKEVKRALECIHSSLAAAQSTAYLELLPPLTPLFRKMRAFGEQLLLLHFRKEIEATDKGSPEREELNHYFQITEKI